jgi:hypothetical protein
VAEPSAREAPVTGGGDTPWNVAAVRYGLPGLTAVVGVVLVVTGGDAVRGAGIVLVGIAGLIVLANLLIRLAIQSQDDREREEQRRRYFTEHGRWPRR